MAWRQQTMDSRVSFENNPHPPSFFFFWVLMLCHRFVLGVSVCTRVISRRQAHLFAAGVQHIWWRTSRSLCDVYFFFPIVVLD